MPGQGLSLRDGVPCIPPDLLRGPRTIASAALIHPPLCVTWSRQVTSRCHGDSSATCLALVHSGYRPGSSPVPAALSGQKVG